MLIAKYLRVSAGFCVHPRIPCFSELRIPMPNDQPPAPSEALSRWVTIRNQRGLHARAAAKFVKLANTFTAEITVQKGDMTVSGMSIMGLMMLAASPGTEIEIRTKGAAKAEALAALVALVERRFDEE
jgi:phosphocarrier protein